VSRTGGPALAVSSGGSGTRGRAANQSAAGEGARDACLGGRRSRVVSHQPFSNAWPVTVTTVPGASSSGTPGPARPLWLRLVRTGSATPMSRRAMQISVFGRSNSVVELQIRDTAGRSGSARARRRAGRVERLRRSAMSRTASPSRRSGTGRARPTRTRRPSICRRTRARPSDPARRDGRKASLGVRGAGGRHGRADRTRPGAAGPGGKGWRR